MALNHPVFEEFGRMGDFLLVALVAKKLSREQFDYILDADEIGKGAGITDIYHQLKNPTEDTVGVFRHINHVMLQRLKEHSPAMYDEFKQQNKSTDSLGLS